MKKTKTILIAVCAVLCATALLQSSCNKKPKGSFTIKGKLIENCDGNPMSNTDLVVYLRRGGGFVGVDSKDSIGYGKTDADGNFELVCQNWGKGELRLYTPAGFGGHDYFDHYYVEGVEGKTIDFNTIYYYTKFIGTVNISIIGTYAASDTLYIANKPYYPVPTGTTLKEYFEFSEGYLALSEYSRIYNNAYYWAIGKAAYDAAVASRDSTQRFSVKQSLCNMPEQITNVTIGK